MATTKTLTPTNQAITLAAFTEKPDNRTNVTNDDKLADAVNALNSNLTELSGKFVSRSISVTTNSSGSFTQNVKSNQYVLIGVSFDQNLTIVSTDMYDGNIWIVTNKANTALTGTAIYYKYA